MDDDTQKEKNVIPSFGGDDDVFMGKSSCFELLGIKDLIFDSQRIESCCFSSKGIDLC